MGGRYFVSVTCPKCGLSEENVYYAPTCGFTGWMCPKCGTVIDLAKLIGISREDASNRDAIAAVAQIQQDSAGELLAARHLMAVCLPHLPQGYLRDTIRTVAEEGRSPADAWEALQEMLR